MKNEVIELRKSGKFYNCFGEDATIIHHLLNYKIVPSKGGVGFPESAYNKVINTLDEAKISYKVYEKDIILAETDYKKINNYKKVLVSARKELSFEQRIENIEKKIKTLSAKKINCLLELIEDAIS